MTELKRTLGFWMTSAFVLLNLINTGIFFTVAIAVGVAREGAILAIGVLAVMSVYTAMCFAELTTMFPSAGGVYAFARRAYGSFFSFEIGWTLWLINNIATALLVVASIDYLLPAEALAGLPLSPLMIKLGLAVLAILIMNYVAYRGADSSARMMLVLGAFTISLLFIVIIPGLLAIHTDPFHFLAVPWAGVFVAIFLLSETFFGWESVSFMAEEIKDPERTIPRALIWTTVFAALISVAVAIVTIGVIGIDRLATEQIERPIIEVLQQMAFPQWLILFANLAIVASFAGNAIGSVVSNPRLLMALSRDKLFIEQFAEIHPRHQTPYRAILIQTIVAVLIILLSAGAYQRLLEMVVAPSIVIYAATLFLVPYFRWRLPKQERPYRTPLGAFLPLALVVFYGATLVLWALTDPGAINQVRLLTSFLIFSAPIYLLLTYFYNPDALIRTMNRFAFLNLWLENMLVPKRLRREVLALLPEARGKRVVELGAGVGSLTLHLAEHVGREGSIRALDLSKGNVRILQGRLKRRGHTHVEVIHDPHLVNRVHPSLQNADIVVSIGTLSYIQDVGHVLKELADILPERGRVCFVEYVDVFWFLPNNPKWLSDPDEVRRVFAEAGFSVGVHVRRGVFWKYLYIHGFKGKSGVPYI